MKRKLVSIGVILAIVISGFVIYISNTYTDALSKEELLKSEEKAKKATIEYFKEVKKMDVIIDEVGIVGELGPSRILLDGHVVENENQKIHAVVTFEETRIVEISGEISK